MLNKVILVLGFYAILFIQGEEKTKRGGVEKELKMKNVLREW